MEGWYYNNQNSLTSSNVDKKEEKPPENINDSDIKKLINKITKGDGMKNIDLKDAMDQLKSSGIDIEYGPKTITKLFKFCRIY